MEAINVPLAGGAKELDEIELLAFRARQDAAAFGQLYLRYREPVFRYLRARCASDDQALEVAAVTFERAFVAIGRYRSRGGGFLAWLFRIARNAAIDEARRRRRGLPLAALADQRSRSPEDLVLESERRDRLVELVAGLPDPQRDAIALRYGAGLTAREIGRVIGKSEQATQKLISRALARLREDFDEC